MWPHNCLLSNRNFKFQIEKEKQTKYYKANE